MSWASRQRGRAFSLALISLSVVLAGCASRSTSDDQAAAAEAAAREDALRVEFQSAVQAMENGDLSAAQERFERLHQDNPERTGPLANLGILAFEEGDLEKAKAHFEQVVALDSAHVTALNYLGVIAREQGEFDVAEQYYRQALASESDHLPAMMNLAILLDIYLGRPAEALPLYERYQDATGDANPRLKDWIFDVKNRM